MLVSVLQELPPPDRFMAGHHWGPPCATGPLHQDKVRRPRSVHSVFVLAAGKWFLLNSKRPIENRSASSTPGSRMLVGVDAPKGPIHPPIAIPLFLTPA